MLSVQYTQTYKHKTIGCVKIDYFIKKINNQSVFEKLRTK